MSKKTLPLDILVNNIIESILDENILDKEKLPGKIRSLLSVWLKVINAPADWDATDPKTDLGKVKKINAEKEIKNLYWREKLKSLVSEDQMKKWNEEINNITNLL